jgi:hypothetical protein
MESVITAIVGVLMLLGAGTLTSSFYHSIKKETILRVHRGLTPMTGFTQKLTGTKLKL